MDKVAPRPPPPWKGASAAGIKGPLSSCEDSGRLTRVVVPPHVDRGFQLHLTAYVEIPLEATWVRIEAVVNIHCVTDGPRSRHM